VFILIDTVNSYREELNSHKEAREAEIEIKQLCKIFDLLMTL